MHYLFLALFVIAWVLLVVGGIMLIVAAFRVSVVWGLCVLFLGPAGLIFLIMHWEEAKRAFGIQMLGMLLALAAIFSGMGSGASTLQGVTETLANSGIAEQQFEALQKLAEESMPTEAGADNPTPSKPVKLSGKDPQSLVGATLADARETLGRPKGEMKSGGEICFLYDNFTVFSADGKTVSHVELGDGTVSGGVKRLEKNPGGVTMPGGSAVKAVNVISKGGERVDLKSVLVPGKITVVDFYADWCGPCKRMAPELESLARQDPAVVLCKIDIVNWNTPVVRQFGIRSIPNVRVFSGSGAAVGSPTSNLDEIKRNIERAR